MESNLMCTYVNMNTPNGQKLLRGLRQIMLMLVITTFGACADVTKNESGTSAGGSRSDDIGSRLLFFGASDGVHGVELWATSETGTELMQDLIPGPADGHPRQYTAFNGRYYFLAVDGLWRTDGTPSSTILIKQITNSGKLIVFNGAMYFVGTDPDLTRELFGLELWKTDGTIEGTMMVKDIRPGAESSEPMELTVVQGTLFFTAETSVEGRELWKTDGTEAGTVMVKNINPIENVSLLDYPNPGSLTVFGGSLYFVANDGPGGHGTELWKSDGTAAGTMMVKDIFPGANPASIPFSADPRFLTLFNGKLYFTAFDDVGHNGLWASDGTANGTMFVKEVVSAIALTPSNDALYYLDSSPTGQRRLWKSNGTAMGTVLVKDIEVLPRLAVFNGAVYFAANDGTRGYELWKSNGTEAGTMLVKDINPGAGGSGIARFAVFRGALYFGADDGAHGVELWKSDGTEAGTAMVKDVCTGNCSSQPTFE
jgi:ELWxxDGT repeat protein